MRTLFGRIRPIPDINSKDFNLRHFAERTAVNSPIQGTAADIIKIAMIRIHRRLQERQLSAKILLQVHDELVIEVPEAEAEADARPCSGGNGRSCNPPCPPEGRSERGGQLDGYEIIRNPGSGLTCKVVKFGLCGGQLCPHRCLEEKRLASELREEALQSIDLDVADAPTSDNSLVREFISGNDAAFAQLVSRYKDSITNYLNMMVGDYDIAVDLCQETFLRVYRNIHRYSNVYQFSTWIYRIATNLAIDEMRYRKRRGRCFTKTSGETGNRLTKRRPNLKSPMSGADRGTRCCAKKAVRCWGMRSDRCLKSIGPPSS